MKIWKLDTEVDLYDSLRTKKKWSYEYFTSFDGRNHSSLWSPTEVERAEPERGLVLSDTPWMDCSLPIFSDRVKSVVESLLGDAVEFLPLICEEGKYWAVNVTNVLDCIDYEKSKFLRFPSSGRIMVFEKYSFIEEKVEGEDVFKITDKLLTYPFVSDRFKELIEANNFEGFKFKLVWDSEEE